MRRGLLVSLLLAGAWAQAGSLETGVYAWAGRPGLSLVLDLETPHRLGLSLAPFRLGVSFEEGLGLGPLGDLGLRLQGEVGAEGLGGVAEAQGVVGPLALEGRLGYRPRGQSPLFPEEGVFGGVGLRYRLVPGEVLELQGARGAWLGYRAPSYLEARYTSRSPGEDLSLGVGVAARPYLLLGLRREGEEGEVYALLLRLGGWTALEARAYLSELSLGLTLAYPWRGSLGVWLGDLGLEVGYQDAPWAWLRYIWRWP